MNQETPKTPSQSESQPTEMFSAYRPRIMVKFHDSIQLPYEDGAEKYFDQHNARFWERFARQFPGVTLKRVFTSLSPEKIRELVARAAKTDKTYRPPNFLTYFAIECPTGITPQTLIKALSNWEAIQTSYEDGAPAPHPAVGPTDDGYFPWQDYLDPAPLGIGVQCAWKQLGGDGEGMWFVDLEQNWDLHHPDLPDPPISLISGLRRYEQSHGTSVLGIVVAVDNAEFHVGIAPKASARVISEWRPADASRTNPADAIMEVIAMLRFGDVLLLETQYLRESDRSLWPSEGQMAVRNAIRAGVALGIVVVEAAGNGGNNLDEYVDASGNRILNQAGEDPDNSCAILVGAASAALPHSRVRSSNFGKRVNCYAWGESVNTLDAEEPLFTANFSGTSSASAIVAGAALVIQGIAKKKFGRCYEPRELRSILSNQGTPSGNPATDRIGVMPDLCKIIQNLREPIPRPDM